MLPVTFIILGKLFHLFSLHKQLILKQGLSMWYLKSQIDLKFYLKINFKGEQEKEKWDMTWKSSKQCSMPEGQRGIYKMSN